MLLQSAFGNLGGSGATLGLLIAIFLVARKDKQQMTIGNLIGWLSTSVFKIISPVTVDIGWTMPGFLIPFLGSGGTNPLSLVIGVLCVIVSTLIYLPFVSAAAKINMRNAEEE